MTKKLGMVVIDKASLNKMCVMYNCEVHGVDFEEAVAKFFDKEMVEVPYKEIEKIAKTIFNKGFCNWDDCHFEMIYL